jgi:uncharacterized protein (TIGR04141 family)
VGELGLDQDTFVFEEGAFFKVSADYLARLNADVLRFAGNEPVLIDAGLTELEQPYNERAAAPDTCLLLDCKLVPFGDGIELCDILTDVKQLLHVKIYSGSGTLSHLFNQGRVAAELLQVNPEFRRTAQAKIKDESGQDPRFDYLTEDPIRTPDYEIVYGIIRRWNGRTLTTLPFFSKMTFRFAATDLANRGYRVKLVPIQRSAA